MPCIIETSRYGYITMLNARGTNLVISFIPLSYFVHCCTLKFKFALYIFHWTRLDSLWVRVHLGGVRVRVRVQVHQTRVRVHSAWVRVHRGGVRVRVRVHRGRVQVRTRVRTRTRTHPLSPSPDSLQQYLEGQFFFTDSHFLCCVVKS